MKLTNPSGNTFKLDCTGREIYAFAKTFGLVEDGEGVIRLSYGYDGFVHEASELTAEERAEIADHMIARWTAWKEQR